MLYFQSDNTLRVVYSDDHVTEVTADWLYKRRLTEEGKEERKELIKIRKPVIWGDNHRVKKQSYDKVKDPVLTHIYDSLRNSSCNKEYLQTKPFYSQAVST